METKICPICQRLLKVTKNWQDVITKIECPKHGIDFMQIIKPRNKIGKYSGRSKTPYGSYENR